MAVCTALLSEGGPWAHLRFCQSGRHLDTILGSRLRCLLNLHGSLSPTERRRRGCCAAVPLRRVARMVSHLRRHRRAVPRSAAEWVCVAKQSPQSAAAGGRMTSCALLWLRSVRRMPRWDGWTSGWVAPREGS